MAFMFGQKLHRVREMSHVHFPVTSGAWYYFSEE